MMSYQELRTNNKRTYLIFFLLFETAHVTIKLCKTIKGVELFYQVFHLVDTGKQSTDVLLAKHQGCALTSHKTRFLKTLPFGKILIITIYKASEMLKCRFYLMQCEKLYDTAMRNDLVTNPFVTLQFITFQEMVLQVLLHCMIVLS